MNVEDAKWRADLLWAAALLRLLEPCKLHHILFAVLVPLCPAVDHDRVREVVDANGPVPEGACSVRCYPCPTFQRGEKEGTGRGTMAP